LPSNHAITYSAIICFQTALIYFMIGLSTFGTLAHSFMNGLCFVFYSLAQILIFIVLFSNLNHIFPSPRPTRTAFAAFLSLYGLLVAIWTITKLTEISREFFARNAISPQTEHVIETAAVIGMQFVDIVLVIYLVAAITIHLRDVKKTKQRSASIREPEERIDRITLGIKQFVLTFIFTVSSQIESILLITACIASLLGNDRIPYVLSHIFWPLLMPIECIVKSVCLSMMLTINDEWYHSVCFCCHSFTFYFYEQSADRRKRSVYRGLREDMQSSLMMDVEIHYLKSNSSMERATGTPTA